jgi:hypothetical protein
MKNISKILLFIISIASLFSCNGYSPSEGPDQTEIFEKAISIAGTEIAKTREAVLSPTSTYSPTIWATASLIPGENIIATPKPEQQVYTDPEGWYSVNVPANLNPTDQNNRFSNGYRFFETGYLPEMGMMSHVLNVCAWIANIDAESPEESTIYPIPIASNSADCSISTAPNRSNWVKYEIFENPRADPEHRFVYVKTGWSSGNSFEITTITWQEPINEIIYVPELPAISPKEIAAWEKISPILQNVSVTEYTLPPGSNPYREMLVSSLPEEARPEWARKGYSASETKTPEPEKMTLITLGYETETEMIKISSGQYPRTRLYRDGRLLFDYVFDTSDVYSFSTEEGHLTAFVVVTRSIDGSEYHAFLVQNDAIIEWKDSHQDPPSSPILYQNEPLWLKVSDDWQQVQVVKSNSESLEVVYSFAVHTEPMYSTKKFVNWNGHWVWAVRDFLIQDGEIINEKLGFQEIFLWRLIDDKPAYLFRKDGRVGFSYDGKIFPLEYQNIARYMCCGYSVNNPSIGDNSAHFFAERDGVWYYIVLKYR